MVDAAPERPDRGALAIYLLRVSPTEIDPREPFEAGFKIVNAGPVSIELPVSPHLSDLQPSDESLDFHYFSLTLFARMQPERQGPDVGGDGYIALYGRPSTKEAYLNCDPENRFGSKQI